MARIKGINLLAVIKGIKVLGERGRGQVPAHLLHYLDERVLVSSWYSEFEVLELMRIYMRLTASGSRRAWEQMGRLAAHTQAREHYRHLVEAREPARVIQQAHVLWRLHHDTGELAVTVESETAAVLDLRGYEALCPEWCDITTGFVAGLVEVAGAPQPRVHVQASDLAQKTVSWRAAWSQPLDAPPAADK